MADVSCLENDIFAQNLKRLMKENRITQAQLACDLSIAKSSVSAWCRGLKIPSTQLIKDIAKYFGIKKEDLFYSESRNAEKITQANEAPVCDEMLKEALFGKDSGATDEQFEEVKSFARFILHNGEDKDAFYYGLF